MFKTDREAWDITATILVGFAIALASAMAVGAVVDKVFSYHLWPRLVTAVLVVSVLVFLLFRKRGVGK